MKLALRLNLYRAADLAVPVDLVRAAEDLGYHSVWTAEAYGADALSPLAYLAALTRGSSSAPRSCRSRRGRPATLAMHAHDDRRAGRRRPGDHRHRRVGPADRRGLVRPAVGQARTRACATTSTIMRKVLDREGPVSHDGPEISLPYRGPGLDRAGQAADVDPAPDPEHPDLAGRGRPEEHRAVRRDRRRLAADGPRSRRHASLRQPLDRGHRGATRGGRPPTDFEVFSGMHGRASPTTSQGVLDAHAPADGHVRRRHGQRDAQLPPGRDGAARLPRGGGADPASCGWPAARRRRSPPCPTNTSSRPRSLGVARAHPARWDAGFVVEPGVTGLIVGAEQLEAPRAHGRPRRVDRPGSATDGSMTVRD